MTADPKRPQRALVLSGGGGRGAFQCGVIEKLDELGWIPDVIVGTSIGSMNAAIWAVGGTRAVQHAWNELRTRDMQRFVRFPPWRSLLDRQPWKRTLEKYAPEDQLRRTSAALYIVATDITTGHPVIFTNSIDLDADKPLYQRVPAITHKHLLASSAIPYIYAETQISQSAHWDGAVMYNSPLRPAIDSGATEIFIVLLSPYHDLSDPNPNLPVPGRSLTSRIGYLVDLVITATFESDFEQMRRINQRIVAGRSAPDHQLIRSAIIGPEQWLSALDIVRYHPKRVAELRRLGREAAARTWRRVHGSDGSTWDSLLGIDGYSGNGR